MPHFTTEALLNLGFADVACWSESSSRSGIEYHVDGANVSVDGLLVDSRNSLYAFASGDQVLYIGKTARTIRERLSGYRQPGQTQRTNVRCNVNIRAMLAKGSPVRILVFNPISHLRYQDFEINLAAGLEDSLITKFNPPWNGREVDQAITEEAERENADAAPVDQGGATGTAPAFPPAQIGAPTVGMASFQIILGHAYYDQGIINPGVEASRYLGNHNEPLIIKFGDGSPPVMSTINRTANRSGGARVVGRNGLIANWFQRNFRQGDVVDARVLDRNTILLLQKSG